MVPSHVALLSVLAVLACVLQGCSTDGTCIWNADTMIRGCSYSWMTNWVGCIRGCNGCINDCEKLKCAAFCAKLTNNAECLSNYNALCTNAVQNVERAHGCDVSCSGAYASSRPSWWLVFSITPLALCCMQGPCPESRHRVFMDASPDALAQSSRRKTATWTLIPTVLLALALALSGCCSDPLPLIPAWKPDSTAFNHLANRVDAQGFWRGTAFRIEPPGYIQVEHSACNASGSFCTEWARQKINCHEAEFGMCSCLEASVSGRFCQKWACKALEADQYVCHFKQECHYSDDRRRRTRTRRLSHSEPDALSGFAENLPEFVALSDGAANASAGSDDESALSTTAERRRLDTTCNYVKECFESPLNLDETKYRMIMATKLKFQKMTSGEHMWSLLVHDAPLWGWMQTEALCITPGDFVGSMYQKYEDQRRYCRGQAFFREIEEQASHCECQEHSADASHCSTWSCLEVKDGIFGVLFEKPLPHMEDYVEGMKMEKYACRNHDNGTCTAWAGEMQSWKAAEMEMCECRSPACTLWVCDKYKLPVTQGWWYYPEIWIPFGLLMLAQCSSSICLAGNLGAVAVVFGAGAVMAGCVFKGLGIWGFLVLCSPALLVSGLLLILALARVLLIGVEPMQDDTNEESEHSILTTTDG